MKNKTNTTKKCTKNGVSHNKIKKVVLLKRNLTGDNDKQAKKLSKTRIKFSIVLRSIAAACVIASIYDIFRVSYKEIRPYTTKERKTNRIYSKYLETLSRHLHQSMFHKF